MSEPMVYVAFPVFNRIESTKSFLEDIKKQTYKKVKVVICDDGSTDGTTEYITRNFPGVTVIQGTGDLWWTGGINKCIEFILSIASDDDFVLTINNDVSVGVDYISQKVTRSSEYLGAIIGSVCVFQDAPNVIETTGMILDKNRLIMSPLVKGCSQLNNVNYSGCVPVTNLPGKGVLIPVSVYKKIGIYDHVLFPHYHADSDFTLRAHAAAIPVLVDFDSMVKSDINTNNMNYAAGYISIGGIVKTYCGIHSCNNFRTYYNLARKHVPDHWKKYLFITYVRIFGGQIKRYFLQFLKNKHESN